MLISRLANSLPGPRIIHTRQTADLLLKMRNLEFYALECMSELDAIKIKYSPNISFVINTRAKARLGLCKKIGNSYVIEISKILLDEHIDVKHGLKNTIIHELLHTCRGCMKHTGKWAELAAKVNAAYGYNIKRASNSSDGIIPPWLQAQPKYIILCTGCQTEITRIRRSPLVDNPQNYRCAKCGGKLERIK